MPTEIISRPLSANAWKSGRPLPSQGVINAGNTPQKTDLDTKLPFQNAAAAIRLIFRQAAMFGKGAQNTSMKISRKKCRSQSYGYTRAGYSVTRSNLEVDVHGRALRRLIAARLIIAIPMRAAQLYECALDAVEDDAMFGSRGVSRRLNSRRITLADMERNVGQSVGLNTNMIAEQWPKDEHRQG
jgi:hypothetical protein